MEDDAIDLNYELDKDEDAHSHHHHHHHQQHRGIEFLEEMPPMVDIVDASVLEPSFFHFQSHGPSASSVVPPLSLHPSPLHSHPSPLHSHPSPLQGHPSLSPLHMTAVPNPSIMSQGTRRQHDSLMPTKLVLSLPSMEDGLVYNDRGYEVCGHVNQHGKPCQRIGRCPFHAKDSKEGAVEGSSSGGEAGNAMEDEVSVASPSKRSKKGNSKMYPYKQAWSKDEHLRFLSGLRIHGKGAWKEISQIVRSRTPTQIQSHAQKYYLRLNQQKKTHKSIHDITMDDSPSLMHGMHPMAFASPLSPTPAYPANPPYPMFSIPSLQCGPNGGYLPFASYYSAAHPVMQKFSSNGE